MNAACREPVRILGTGAHAPARVLGNEELATMVETSDALSLIHI